MRTVGRIVAMSWVAAVRGLGFLPPSRSAEKISLTASFPTARVLCSIVRGYDANFWTRHTVLATL